MIAPTESGVAPSIRMARWLIVAGVLSALLVSATSTIMAVRLNRGLPIWDTIGDVTLVLSGVAMTLIAAPICLKQLRNPIGWLLLIGGVAVGLAALGKNFLDLATRAPAANSPAVFIGAWLTDWMWSVPYALVPVVLLLFPDGRFLTPRWRWAGYASGLWLAFVVVLVTFEKRIGIGTEAVELANPIGLWTIPSWLLVGLLFVVLALLGLGTLSVALRWRRGDYVLRQQVKYLALAMLPVIIVLALAASNAVDTPWFGTVVNLVVLLIPAAIALAVGRYRLYDIDFVLRRTTSYALLTALLAAVYFSSVVFLQRLISPITGDSTAAVVFSTLLIAALFLPLRRRVQSAIDRRFYRRKYNAEQVLARFAATVRDETDLDALTAELLRVIQETMQPESVSLWLKPTADGRPRMVDDRRWTTDDG